MNALCYGTHVQGPKKHPVAAVILALLIAILIQIPFAILFVMPRFAFGVPGIGLLFFWPAFAVVRMFSTTGSGAVFATVALQTLITFVPIFWLITWKRRPALNTLARVFAFTVLVIAATAIATPLEQRHEARNQVREINGKSPVLSSIERLNGSLAFFKKRYGQYPDSVAQLDFPPDQAEVDAHHAGLIQFPLPMQDFFDFTYARQGTGYELRIDGKAGQGWQLYHYCSDHTGVIRFDTSRDKCPQGAVVYSKAR